MLERDVTGLLQALIRMDTVNPPGNERPAIDHLETYLSAGGFSCRRLAAVPERPNLVARLDSGSPGPVLCLLAHVDTVLADADDWQHDPWSGEIDAGGYLWGRGAIDMKSQAAAQAAAAVSLVRDGWRPARGALQLVFVSDEETGGEVGARWLCDEHPELVRCDYLLNEGAGAAFTFGGVRRYGVCCGEKGIFRFLLTARGRAGHASMPFVGENALVKLLPVLNAIAGAQPTYEVVDAPAALIRALGGDPADPAQTLAALRDVDPRLPALIEPMFGVTLCPTMIHASEKMNVIPSRATLKIDCRVPPGLGREAALAGLHEVLGDASELVDVAFTEEVYGYASPPDSPLRDAIDGWIAANDPGAETVPLLLTGYSDSSWFRRAFPDLIAYGFFPHRHQPLVETAPLMHAPDERIDTRDLLFAERCYADVARELLG